nr:MAG TPA: hypothetical protein [Caudoviricetes sp.]DAH64170.1 MAG TPA: hypothetical protein [Caudoviricetes sp.]
MEQHPFQYKAHVSIHGTVLLFKSDGSAFINGQNFVTICF